MFRICFWTQPFTGTGFSSASSSSPLRGCSPTGRSPSLKLEMDIFGSSSATTAAASEIATHRAGERRAQSQFSIFLNSLRKAAFFQRAQLLAGKTLWMLVLESAINLVRFMDKFIYFMQIDQVLMLPLGIKTLKSPVSRFFDGNMLIAGTWEVFCYL